MTARLESVLVVTEGGVSGIAETRKGGIPAALLTS